jgi:hypothetical protein
LQTTDLNQFDIICKFDADIIFPKNYLKRINEVYENNPKAGMVSGLVKIKKSVFEKSLAFDFKDEKINGFMKTYLRKIMFVDR